MTASSTDETSRPKLPESAYNALQSMYATEIGTRLKVLETAVDPTIPPTQTYVIRLDGVAFHTFLKGVKKPFDHRIGDSMVACTMDLMQRFHPVTAYTQSDEISLVFPNVEDPVKPDSASLGDHGDTVLTTDASETVQSSTSAKNGSTSALKQEEATDNRNKKRKRPGKPQTHMYSGRIQKLATVTASYAAARFNHHMASHAYDDLAPSVSTRLKSGVAYFDARLIPCSSAKDAMECIFWRSNFDGLRNAVHAVGQSLFNHKELQNKSVLAQIDMCWKHHQFNVFTQTPNRYLYGVWIKKEIYELKGITHPKTGQPLEGVTRHRLRKGSFNWADWSEAERIAFVMAKLWEAGGSWPPKDDLESNVGKGLGGGDGGAVGSPNTDTGDTGAAYRASSTADEKNDGEKRSKTE
ncbi:hypothetical protein SeMB42_g07136 [Synchytrium endobioticum]|uniref:tRNA(His) guanylyltransferase n=1 Tax=Synchytrium endobioticum TaxID=286115 RepID=A0A507C8H9_9FUNG|nr:hypothetical protein SeMB42_g07136 [Synchytrium endobioticum]